MSAGICILVSVQVAIAKLAYVPLKASMQQAGVLGANGSLVGLDQTVVYIPLMVSMLMDRVHDS